MEHPEKALFDEVLSLKKDIEESKERVKKLKTDYKEKIALLEKRSSIKDRSEDKFRKWQSASKKTVTLQLDEMEYILLKSTIENNIYKVSNKIFPENETCILIDAQKSFFKLFLLILRNGNSAFNSIYNGDGEIEKVITKSFSNLIDKYTKDDQNFNKFLEEFFERESFFKIVSDFALNYESFPKVDLKDLYVKHTIVSPYNISNMNKHLADSVQSLGDPKNTKGFFLNYNGKIEIELAESVRVRRIFVKPFCYDSSIWSPTSGNTYTTIYASMNGDDWEYVINLPSNYGNNSDGYLCEINFRNFVSFKYIRFITKSSSFFSISYLSFTRKEYKN